MTEDEAIKLCSVCGDRITSPELLGGYHYCEGCSRCVVPDEKKGDAEI